MTINELTFLIIIILEISFFIAYFLKGFSGFGPALIVVPTVAFILNPALALGSSAFVDIIVGLGLLLSLKYQKSDIAIIIRISVLMFIGTLIGGSLAGVVSPDIILVLIAVVIFGFGMNILIFKQQTPAGIELKKPWLLWAGSILGGFTGGLVGICGPFVVMACKAQMDKDSFRRILVAVFFAEGIFRLIVYMAVDIWTADVFRLALIVSPAIIFGLAAGYFSHLNVSEKLFGIIIGLLLILISMRIFLSFIAG